MVERVHPHDAGQILDDFGVMVRTGHHCAWLVRFTILKVPISTRVAFVI